MTITKTLAAREGRRRDAGDSRGRYERSPQIVHGVHLLAPVRVLPEEQRSGFLQGFRGGFGKHSPTARW